MWRSKGEKRGGMLPSFCSPGLHRHSLYAPACPVLHPLLSATPLPDSGSPSWMPQMSILRDPSPSVSLHGGGALAPCSCYLWTWHYRKVLRNPLIPFNFPSPPSCTVVSLCSLATGIRLLNQHHTPSLAWPPSNMKTQKEKAESTEQNILSSVCRQNLDMPRQSDPSNSYGASPCVFYWICLPASGETIIYQKI